MLKWDARYHLEDYQITYIHRGAPKNLRTVRVVNLILHAEVFGIDETEIPYHRILEIKNHLTGAILFKKNPPKTSGV